MSRPTVIASLVRSIVHGAEHAGIDRRAILEHAAIDEQRLEPDDRVAYGAYVALWEEIGRRTSDPFFGLHLAESSLDESSFSTVGFAARSCETFGAAVERVVAYSLLLNEATETRLELRGREARVFDGPRDLRRPWPRHTAECILAAWVVLGERWTGADLRPNFWYHFSIRAQTRPTSSSASFAVRSGSRSRTTGSTSLALTSTFR